MSDAIGLFSALMAGLRTGAAAPRGEAVSGFEAVVRQGGEAPGQAAPALVQDKTAAEDLYGILAGLGKKAALLEREGAAPAETVEAVAGLASDLAGALAEFEDKTGLGLLAALKAGLSGDDGKAVAVPGAAESAPVAAIGSAKNPEASVDPAAAVDVLQAAIAQVAATLRGVMQGLAGTAPDQTGLGRRGIPVSPAVLAAGGGAAEARSRTVARADGGKIAVPQRTSGAAAPLPVGGAEEAPGWTVARADGGKTAVHPRISGAATPLPVGDAAEAPGRTVVRSDGGKTAVPPGIPGAAAALAGGDAAEAPGWTEGRADGGKIAVSSRISGAAAPLPGGGASQQATATPAALRVSPPAAGPGKEQGVAAPVVAGAAAQAPQLRAGPDHGPVGPVPVAGGPDAAIAPENTGTRADRGVGALAGLFTPAPPPEQADLRGPRAQALLARVVAAAAGQTAGASAPALPDPLAPGAVPVEDTARRLGPAEPLIAPEDIARAVKAEGQAGRDPAAPAAQARPAANGAEQPRFAAALAAQIRSAEIREGHTRIELSPRGLGTIEVDVSTGADGSLKVVVRADNPAVLNSLRAERDLLAEALGGLDAGSLDLQSFSDGSGDDPRDNSAPEPLVAAVGEGAKETGADPAPARNEEIGDGRLDIVT